MSEEDNKACRESDSNVTFARRLQFEQVTAAEYKIRNGVSESTCIKSRMSEQLGANVYFKKEFMQYTGSFKERGVRNALLLTQSPDSQVNGVVAVSAGSYAFALAYQGYLLHVPVVLFMPTYAPLMHTKSCANYNATVFVQGDSIEDTTRFAKQYAEQKNLMFLDLRKDVHVIAGNATVGLEIVGQVPRVDIVVIPLGDGTLAAGMALAIKSCKPNVRVIASFCPSLNRVITTLNTPPSESESDSVTNGVLMTRQNLYLTSLMDEIVSVSENEVAAAIVKLVEMEKCLVEEDGACAFAAVSSGKVLDWQGKNVVVVLSEGNMDTASVGRVIERGLVASGRLHEITLVVPDRPGGLHELTGFIHSADANVIQVYHDRRFAQADIKKVQVKCIVETCEFEHALRLKKTLSEHYGNVHFSTDSTDDCRSESLYDFS